MRILHTSDWHLGHTLQGRPRDHEHGRFLGWLLEVLDRERVDALLISGDVFDNSNPSADANRAFYGFLANAVTTNPELQVVIVAGNHDSAARLVAPHPILDNFRVHVVGFLRRPDGALDLDRLLVPLRDRSRADRVLCCAIPFLRPADLPRFGEVEPEDGRDPLIEGVRAVHAEVFAAARARLRPGQKLIAMAHAYMVGSRLSQLSERKVLGGNQHALPVDVFPDDVSYVALGHLHRPQIVGDRETMRYSGSPIPLALTEASYRHQVVLIELGDDRARLKGLRVPRSVDIVRVPQTGALPLADLRRRLRELPSKEEFAAAERPYLEVAVRLDEPLPDLRAQIEEVLEDRGPRLVKISVTHEGSNESLSEQRPHQSLEELTAEEVFRALYRGQHGSDPAPQLLEAFHELVDQIAQQNGGAT